MQPPLMFQALTLPLALRPSINLRTSFVAMSQPVTTFSAMKNHRKRNAFLLLSALAPLACVGSSDTSSSRSDDDAAIAQQRSAQTSGGERVKRSPPRIQQRQPARRGPLTRNQVRLRGRFHKRQPRGKRRFLSTRSQRRLAPNQKAPFGVLATRAPVIFVYDQSPR